MTSGFRLYKRTALEKIAFENIKSTGYSFQVELLYRLHLRDCTVAESPIVFYDRTLGESKLARREIYIGAMRLILLRLGAGRARASMHQHAASTSASQ